MCSHSVFTKSCFQVVQRILCRHHIETYPSNKLRAKYHNIGWSPACQLSVQTRSESPTPIAPSHYNNTQIFRILPPPPAWIVAKLGHANPQCFGDSRDSKNESIFGARREIQRRRRHAPSQHGRTRTPKELARNAKNPGKTRVLQQGLQKTNGEDWNRTTGCFPYVFEEFERCT